MRCNYPDLGAYYDIRASKADPEEEESLDCWTIIMHDLQCRELYDPNMGRRMT